MTGKKASCFCTSLLCCAMVLTWASQRAVADNLSDLQVIDDEMQKKAEYLGLNFKPEEIDEAASVVGSNDTELIFEYLNGFGGSGDPRGGGLPNDLCANGIALTIGGPTELADNTTAGDDIIPSGTCTTSAPFKGLWYTVVGDGTTLTVSTCHPGTTFDTKLQVFCDCTDYPCIGGNDDASPSGDPACAVGTLNRKSRVTWCSISGQTYRIHVGGFSATTFGGIEIGVTSNGTACGTQISCTPPVRRCCYVDMGVNTCNDFTASQCAAVSGTWSTTAGQTCTTACPTGRCCYNDNGTSACAAFFSQSACNALNGIWTASSSCATACPSGRCCYMNAGVPSCLDAANEAVCRDLGGSWFVSQTCAARPCLSNEYCDTAENITTLPFVAAPNVTGAGGSFKPAAQSGCNSTTARSMQNDIWYKYTPASDCSLAFSANSPSYDSVYAVYTGSDCSSLTQVACADAEPHNFNVAAVGGTTYWFQIGKWGTSTTPPTNGLTNVTLDCIVGGSCCLSDGSCQTTADAAACTTLGGVYGGDGSSCSLTCAGACCDSSSVCTDAISQLACEATGGTFRGRGTLCATTICPPSNDNCANAIAIGNGTTPFNLGGATTDGPNEPSCAFPSGGTNQNMNQDIWYTYTATCDGNLFVDTCGAATTDTRLAVYDGFACPPAGPPLECNDDHSNATEADTGFPCVAESLAASLSVPVVQGQVYTIRVGAFSTSGTISGADQLNVQCIGLTGRCCYTFFGVLEECADTTQADCETVGGSFEGIWTPGVTCASDPCPTGSCCASDGSCTITTEDRCNDNLGTWTLNGVCDPNTCPAPPANDTCATAIAVSCGDSLVGSNVLANDDYTFTAAGCSGFASQGPDVVYSFTTPVSRDVSITMDPDAFDLGLYVVTDCNDPEGSCVVGQDSGGSGTAEIANFTAAANTTYYIIVDTFSLSGAPGDSFTLTVDCPIGTCASCPGDMNADGRLNGADVQGFTDCVVGAIGGIPPSGCACADMNGDQLVDMNDVPLFVSALLAPGPVLCPPGPGRCCLLGGTVCDDTVTQIECTTAGGTFTAGLTCATPCPQIADNCSDLGPAQAVPATFTGDNTTATDDAAPAACGVSTPNQGLWHAILGTGNTITLTTCNAATNFDTMVEVFCGECAAPFCVGGNDDALGGADANCFLTGGTVNRKSRLSFCSIAGTVYRIRVSGFGTTTGQYQLDVTDDGVPCTPTVSCVPPTGACCQGNSCSVETPGTCSGLGGTYLGDGSDCTGNPCATGACCHPDGSCTQEASAAACTTAGGSSFAGIAVTCAAANCPQPGQPGETCPVATTIPSLPFSTQFNNDLATADGPPGSCNTASATVMQNAVWYNYTPASDCTLVLNISDVAPGYDMIALVHSGPDCNSLTTLTPCLDEPEPISGTFPATGGTTYWFQVGDWGTAEGGGLTNFSLDCVAGGACCLANGTCTDVASSAACATAGGTYSGDATSCATTICGGACCHPNGSCTDELTGADCTTAGGTFQGNGTACATTNCPQPPPANDGCATAIDITGNINAGSVNGNNGGATPAVGPDGELPAGSPTCHWNATPGSTHNTVWYSFTAPANGSVTIGTCNTTPNPTGVSSLFQDSVIALYSGSCGALTEVSCADDTTGCGPADDYYSQFSNTTLTPGTTYYLMVGNPGGWTGSFPGAFTVDITSP